MVTIETRNCRGLADTRKRLDVLDRIKKGKIHIACLHDVHLNKKDRAKLRGEWGGNVYLSAKSSLARGVAILIRKDLEYKVFNVICDEEGNYVILDIAIEGHPRLTLVSLYGPNSDSPLFFKEIWEKISSFGNLEIIVCGDWNTVRDYRQDTYNYVRKNNPKARDEISRGMEILELRDVWRSVNQDSFKFTWGTQNPVKRARLDYFLTSQAIANITMECSIQSKYRSDHSPVTLKLNTAEHKIGPGFWKLNTSLLKNEDLVNKIKDEILQAKATYAATPYNPDYINSCPNSEVQLTIGDSLFWETLLVQIRGVIIKFAASEKRKRCKGEGILIKKIEKLEQECSGNKENPVLQEELNETNRNLQILREPKIEGIKLRAKAQWVEEGEKSSKFFLQQEKSNFVNKTIKELLRDDKSRISDQKEILDYIKDFYQTLYTQQPRLEPLEKTMEKLDFSGLKRIPENFKEGLEGELSMEELTKALNGSKNNKSPGPDGYPVEFYKHFWDKLGPFLLRALNENFKNKAFSASQSQGVITCIPKGDKDRKLLKNWRPISLLNSSYKLASTCIANRIKPILPYIIKTQQKGFIQGRNIADCTREIYDFLYECEENDVPGLLLLIDFQKAFDSIAWDFIYLALREFDFPKTIVEWVYMMQLNPVSRVSQSGWMSDPFVLQRGCRQGDPLSPYVFILCAEFMSQAIKNSPDIVGYNIKGHEEKLTLFADDTSLFLDGSKNSLRKAISILKTYEEASGLKINVSKTKAVWVGRNRFSTDTICHEIELDWVHEFVALGVTYNVRDLQGIVQQNCVEKLAEMDRILLSWSRRNTTLVGRILIIKSLALSKLVHFFISLPSPPKDFVRELNKKFFRFLWKGKPPKIKRTTLELDFNEGGLRMVNVERFEKTMKIKWLKRMLSSNDVWKVIPEAYRY